MDSLMQHLTRHKALAENLLIEVTESAQSADLARLSESAKRIRDAGFKVCLDDFGAGASGFQYLKNIKVDFVKIDGVYVRGAEKDQELRAFLHAMTTLCNGLGIKTIAEHVETETQAEILRGLGCDYAQGFYYGHPLMNLSNALKPVRGQAKLKVQAKAS
jgi:EAL domain-containing protein (putative c-di-GMP-specific phosphodiesterase class I)